MDIVLTFTGSSCDLALHPVSSRTAENIRSNGRKIYSQKYMNWWRRGNTRNFGMRIDAATTVQLTVDGQPVPFDTKALMATGTTLNPELFLGSRARFMAVMGFTDERCTYRWVWRNVDSFDANAFAARVLDLSPCLAEGFSALSDVTYAGRAADEFNWSNPSGFTLIDPVVVDLDRVRLEERVA